MKTVSPPLSEHLEQDVTALSTCWSIIRVDGTEYFFTDFDTDIVVDAVTYISIGAYSRTAIETTVTLAVDNLDVVGLTSDLSLPIQDLRNGLFDNATVTVFLTSWVDGVQGKLKMRKGFFGAVQIMPNGTFKVELRGLLQKLSYVYTHNLSATCLHDLGDSKCQVPIAANFVARSTTYVVGDEVRAVLTAANDGTPYKIPVGDPSFEIAGAAGGVLDNSVYWLNVGTFAGTVNSTEAHNGTYSLLGGAGSTEVRQDIDILSIKGLTSTAVDAGNVYMNFYAYRYDTGGVGTLTVTLLDDTFSVLDTYTTGSETVGATWVQRSDLDRVLPANTRYVRITFSTSSTNARLDNVFGWFVDTSGTDTLTSSLGNVYWECTTAGTTAASAPTFVGGPASTVNDGSVVWTARTAWTRHGVVTIGGNARTFESTITESRDQDSWFDFGVVTFESGINKGGSMEVKKWTKINGSVELFLSLEGNIEAGDIFSIYPGCDKSRVGCSVIFDNILNFFGAPDVPGQDQFFAYPSTDG